MNPYYNNIEFTKEQLDNNCHRHTVGGIWESQSELQLSLSQKYGLTPDSKLLDFGCGCLRGGIKFIKFLNKGNYYGIDVNIGLLKAGLDYEILRYNLQDKVITSNFLITSEFEVDYFKVQFDMIIAQSVFTHLTLNHFCYFMEKCYNSLKNKGTIIVSFWFIEEYEDLTKDKLFLSENFSMKTSYIFDSYHYKFSQIKKLVEDKWNVSLLDDYHPRKQKFILLTKKNK
jgi:cyclopropane fatty-acyl-phospholipid synthase-like methyltransferase